MRVDSLGQQRLTFEQQILVTSFSQCTIVNVKKTLRKSQFQSREKLRNLRLRQKSLLLIQKTKRTTLRSTIVYIFICIDHTISYIFIYQEFLIAMLINICSKRE